MGYDTRRSQSKQQIPSDFARLSRLLCVVSSSTWCPCRVKSDRMSMQGRSRDAGMCCNASHRTTVRTVPLRACWFATARATAVCNRSRVERLSMSLEKLSLFWLITTKSRRFGGMSMLTNSPAVNSRTSRLRSLSSGGRFASGSKLRRRVRMSSPCKFANRCSCSISRSVSVSSRSFLCSRAVRRSDSPSSAAAIAVRRSVKLLRCVTSCWR